MKTNPSHWTLLQYTISQNNPGETLQLILSQITEIFKRQLCDFLVLPEMWLGGPLSKNQRKSWVKIYEKGLLELCKLSKEYKKSLLMSQLYSKNNAYFNQACLINTKGRLEHVYNKIHLFTHGGEGVLFNSPPIRHTLIEYQSLKIAQIICYDVRFPELARDLAHQGAHVLVVHAQWPESRKDHWLTLLKARAIENQIFVIGVNRLGIKKGEHFAGDSVVIDPWGKTILHLNHNQTWGTALIDLTFLKDIRKKYPFFKERRFKKILWK